MVMDDQALFLEKITHIFIGTHDFRQLARQVVDLIVRELKDQNIVTAAIGRLHEKDKLVYAYAYSTKYRQMIDKLLPSRFSELNVALSRTDNLAVRTILTNQMQQSRRMADFSRGMVPDALVDRIQKIMGGKLTLTFPIRVHSGKPAGGLMLVLKDDKLTGGQMILFETLAKQVGLAFSNVFEFEKLMAKYQNLTAQLAKAVKEEDIPSVKFTLRITPKENQNLERIGRERGKTKAEILRAFLDQIEP